MLSCAPRGRNTRSWGAGAPLGRVRCRRIGYDGRLAVAVRAGDHPQQLALGGSLPASDAGPDRSRRAGCRPGRQKTYGCAPPRINTTADRATDSEPGARRLPCSRMARRRASSDRFTGPTLDRAVWFPHYLPAWSLARGDRARRTGSDGAGLILDVPVDHPALVPRRPRRRRCGSPGIQSGSWSGPVGSSRRPAARSATGQLVREEQRALRGLAADRRPGRDPRPG